MASRCRVPRPALLLVLALALLGGPLLSLARDPATALAAPTPATFVTAPGSPIPTGLGARSVATGDFNGDGKLDLAVANQTDNNITNGSKLFNAGFFSDRQAPTDFTLTGNLSSTTPPNGLNNPFGAPSSSYATGLQTSTANTIAESYYICVNQTATMISG